MNGSGRRLLMEPDASRERVDLEPRGPGGIAPPDLADWAGALRAAATALLDSLD
jgi:hypothetical protein